jgi:hypothetical protein
MWSNKIPEPTAVSTGRSAVAVYANESAAKLSRLCQHPDFTDAPAWRVQN